MEEGAIAQAESRDTDEVAPLTYFRLLDSDSDEWLYQDALRWHEQYPAWLTDADPSYSVSTFLEEAKHPCQLDLGCFKYGELVAIASFWERAPHRIEFNMWASREARASDLAPGIWEIGNALFEEGAIEIFTVIARFHLANRRLAERCWMHFDGTRRLKCSKRGRLIEWMRYRITREDWIRRINGNETRD